MANVLRAKYLIKKNILVNCYLDVVETRGDTFTAFVGVKKRADSAIPVGTKLYIKPAAGPQADEIENPETVEVSYTKVLSHEELATGTLHVLSEVKTETRPNQRQHPRRRTGFLVKPDENDLKFQVQNGNIHGLGMAFKSSHAVIGMTIDTTYGFRIYHKGKEYPIRGRICYIEYNWKNYEHHIGLELEKMDEETELVLNILLDPNYKVDIYANQTIDAAEGKISQV